jgi:hypothetical protein
MKCLELPHRQADYLCPVNGLCDVYEWKTGNRMPEDLLFFSRTGFMLISQKKATPPKMIFLANGSIGSRQYNFWKKLMGYDIIENEGKSFKYTLSNIIELINKNIPVILFGLDMYHLPYHTKFYHTVHIPGHIVLMTGYDDKNVYVHDNSKEDIQTVPFTDLCLAWENSYIGISGKNAYFGINFTNPNYDMRDIMKKGLSINADMFFNPPVGFMGNRGFEKFIKEFPAWHGYFDTSVLCEIYRHFLTFTGSVLPELPESLSENNSGIKNPHKGARDRISKALKENKDIIGFPAWEEAANAFQKSGQIIEQIVNGFIHAILDNSFSETNDYIHLFLQLQSAEKDAHEKLLYTNICGGLKSETDTQL